jgi:hypothetical protein
MDIVILSITQLIVPIALGLAVTRYLRGVTSNVLIDLCGTQDRAAFWVKNIAVTAIIMPLLAVLMFTRGPQSCAIGDMTCVAATLRNTVALSLVALLVVVACSAATIWSKIPRPEREARQPGEAAS